MAATHKDRTKGNAKASKSADAANLIAETGTGFIGFGRNRAVGSLAAEGDTTLDNDYQLGFRKLMKKDPTTKLKGLQELAAVFAANGQESVSTALPQWCVAYTRLYVDPDRRVREALNITFEAMIRKVQKQLATHLKSIIGAWVCSMHDSSREVFTAARQAFNSAFPPARRVEAINFGKSEILSTIADNLKQTPQTLSDMAVTSKEDAEEKWELLMSATIGALNYVTSTLPAAQLEAVTADIEAILTEAYWKFALTHKKASIRRAGYDSLRNLCTTLPGPLNAQLAALSPLVLGALGEKDQSTHGAMWEAIISFVRTFPAAWTQVNMRKAILPKLWALLRGGCFGSALVSYQCFLPFISVLPFEVVGDKPDFCQVLFQNMWEGLKAADMHGPQCTALIQSYLECAHFLALADIKRSGATTVEPGSIPHFILTTIVLDATRFFLCEQETAFDVGVVQSALAKIVYGLLSRAELLPLRDDFLASVRAISGPHVAAAPTEDANVLATSASVLARLAPLLVALYKDRQPWVAQGLLQPLSATVLSNLLTAPPHAIVFLKDLVQGCGLASLLAGGDELALYRTTLLPWLSGWIASHHAQLGVAVDIVAEVLGANAETAVQQYDGLVALCAEHGQDGQRALITLIAKLIPTGRKLVSTSLDGLITAQAASLCGPDSKEAHNTRGELLGLCLTGANGEAVVSEATVQAVLKSISHGLFALTETAKTATTSPCPANAVAVLLVAEVALLKARADQQTMDLREGALINLLTLASLPRTAGAEWEAAARLAGEVFEKVDHVLLAGDSSDNTTLRRALVTRCAKNCLVDGAVNADVGASQLASLISTSPSPAVRTELISHVFNAAFLASLLPTVALWDPTPRWSGFSAPEFLLRPCGEAPSAAQVRTVAVTVALLERIPPPEVYAAIAAQSVAAAFNFGCSVLYWSLVAEVFGLGNDADLAGRMLVLRRHVLSAVQPEAQGGAQALVRMARERGGLYVRVAELVLFQVPDWEGALKDESFMTLDAALASDEVTLLASTILRCHATSGTQGRAIPYKGLATADLLRQFNSLPSGVFARPDDDTAKRGYRLLGLLGASLAGQETTDQETVRQVLTRLATLVESPVPAYAPLAASLGDLVCGLLAAVSTPEGQRLAAELAAANLRVYATERAKTPHELLEHRAVIHLYLGARLVAVSPGAPVSVQLGRDLGEALLAQHTFDQRAPTTLGTRVLQALRKAIVRSPAAGLGEASGVDGWLPLLASRSAEVQQMAYLAASAIIKSATTEASDAAERSEASTENATESKAIAAQAIANPVRIVPITDVLKRALATADYDALVASGNPAENYSCMLSWSLVLDHFMSKSQEQRTFVGEYLQNGNLVAPFVMYLFHYISTEETPRLLTFNITDVDLQAEHVLEHVAAHLYLRLFFCVPKLVRAWWNECDRTSTMAIDRYTALRISPVLLESELDLVRSDAALKTDDRLNVVPSLAGRQVGAEYRFNDVVLDLVIRFPPSYPLRGVEIDSERHQAIGEAQWRRWSLSLTSSLNNREYNLVEVLNHWKQNVSSKFDGVEECPICYAIMHIQNHTLPRLACKTCRNKFHSACLYKWFSTSQQSTCPLCRSLF